MSKKAFFSVEYAGARETISKMAETELAMDRITKAIKEAKKAGNEDIYKQLRVEQEKLKKTSTELRGELRQQSRDFEKMKYPKDSVIGMELEYSKLREQVRGLSADQRNSTFGKDLIRQADQVKSQILKVDGSIKDFKSNIGNYQSAFTGLGDFLTGGLLTGGITAAAGVLVNIGTSIVKIGSEYESTSEAFKNAFQDEGRAESYLSMIQDFAAKTPFEFDKLADSTLKLVNRGFVPMQDELTKLGDLASSQKKDFDQLTEAILDAQTGEFERLKEFGIKAKKNNDEVTLSFKDQTITVKNNSQAIREAIINFGELQGVQGSMAVQSQTFNGMISNLKDNLSQMAIAIFNFVSPALKGLVSGVSFITDAWKKLGEYIGPVMVQFEELSFVIKENTGGWLDLSKVLGFTIKIATAPVIALLTAFKYLVEYFTIFLKIGARVVGFFKDLYNVIIPIIGVVLSKTGLSGAFTFVGNIIDGFIDRIVKIPAILSAVGTTIKKVLNDLAKGSFDFNIKDTYNSALSSYNRPGGYGRGNGGAGSNRAVYSTAGGSGGAPPKPKGTQDHLKDYGQTGSITSLEHAYAALQEKIAKTNVNSPLLEGLIIKSNKAKKALDEAKLAYEIMENKNSDKVKNRSLLDLIVPEEISLVNTPLEVDATAAQERALSKQEDLIRKHNEKLHQLGERQLADSDKRRMKEYTQEQLIWAKLKAGVELNEKEKLALKKQFTSAAFDLAKTISDGIFQLEAQEREQDLNEKLAAVDKEYEHKLKAAQGNSVLEEAIKKDLEAKKLSIQKDAFEKDKKAKIAQALISAALAIIQAFAQLGPIAGAISAVGVGIATGFQIASIKRTKFAQGGFGRKGFTGRSSLPPDETGKRPVGVATYHENEYTAPDWQVERNKPLFNSLENERLSYMRGFASGGFSTPPQYVKPAYFSTSTQGNATFTDEQIVYMATRMGGIMAEMNGPAVEKGAARGAYNAGTAINRNNERINSLENDF